MWIGRPPFTVSVAKIRRKSCGVNLNGVPSTSTMAGRGLCPVALRDGGADQQTSHPVD